MVEVNDSRYFVVLAFTSVIEGHEGKRTINIFPDKAYFDQWYDKETKARQTIVAEGVTWEEAVRLRSEGAQ
jgi:hypothetical protein